MNIKIDGALLERLTALALHLQVNFATVVPTALQKGLAELEKVVVRSSDFLADDAKKDIEANPRLSARALALKHNVTPLAVKKHRRFIATAHLIKGGWQTETDGAIGRRFGLSDMEIRTLRCHRGLFREKGKKGRSKAGKYIRKLGGKRVIQKALSRGGKTIADLFREAGVVISKERQRQIFGIIGLTGSAWQRENSWYAERRVHMSCRRSQHS